MFPDTWFLSEKVNTCKLKKNFENVVFLWTLGNYDGDLEYQC